MSKNLSLASRSLEDLLPNSLMSTPSVSIRENDSIFDACSLLASYLESFTDSLVVTSGDTPVGRVGGIEVLDGLLKDPTTDYLDATVRQIMDTHLPIISKQTILSDLVKIWSKAGKAFAIIPHQYGGYASISARKLLEIGASCKTNLKASDIPKKKISTFNNDDTIKKIIESMFEHKTRKLVLENSSMYVSDRIIIEKIARDLDHMNSIKNFLDTKIGSIKLGNAKIISADIEIPKVCEIMSQMQHPYVMTKDQVISPWDIAVFLVSNESIGYS